VRKKHVIKTQKLEKKKKRRRSSSSIQKQHKLESWGRAQREVAWCHKYKFIVVNGQTATSAF